MPDRARDFLEHVSDWWVLILALVAGSGAVAEARYQVAQNAKDIKEIKSAGFMTMNTCILNQNACKGLQCLQHGQYKEDIIKLTRLVEHVSTKVDQNYDKTIRAGNENRKEFMDKIDDTMGRIFGLVAKRPEDRM